MSEFVVDASAVVVALVERTRSAATLKRRLDHVNCHAPHLFDAELGNVLRRKLLAGLLDEQVAATALVAGSELITYRYSHAGWLSRQAWQLKDNITFYDALYVALAERLDIPLLTADARLARAPGISCAVELID